MHNCASYTGFDDKDPDRGASEHDLQRYKELVNTNVGICWDKKYAIKSERNVKWNKTWRYNSFLYRAFCSVKAARVPS